MQGLAYDQSTRTVRGGNPDATVRQRPDHAGCDVLIASSGAEGVQAHVRQLGDRGLRLKIARTGFEAIVKATWHLPRVILLDDSLGADTVAETTRLLAGCSTTAHIPVMRVTLQRDVAARLLRTLTAAAAL
jgi:CheY-like chemotaxis protein